MVEDAADDAALGDECDHPHHASAAGTDEGIELVQPSSRRRSSGRGGGVVRSPGLGSPGPPRSEPSTRGCFRKRVDYSNLSRRPDRMPVYGPGIEKETEGLLWSLRGTAPRNSHCTPTGDGGATVRKGRRERPAPQDDARAPYRSRGCKDSGYRFSDFFGCLGVFTATGVLEPGAMSCG